jgi:hypothetical protein
LKHQNEYVKIPNLRNSSRRETSRKSDQINDADEEDIDEEVDNKSRPEGMTFVTDVTKIDTRNDGAVGFQFGFPEMDDDKRDHLDEDGAFFETIL